MRQTLAIEAILIWVYNRLIPALLGLGAIIGLWYLGQAMERPIYDLLLRWSAKPNTDSPVTLVLIDDASILRLSARFGDMPWARKDYLAMFQAVNAKKPALMVFDSHFVDRGRQEDSRFFKALAQLPNLVSGLAVQEGNREEVRLNTRLPEYYRLPLGVVSMQEDEDGVIRRLKPLFTLPELNDQSEYKTAIFPALSVQAAKEWLERTYPQQGWAVEPASAERGEKLVLKPANPSTRVLSLPLDHQGSFLLRWASVKNRGKVEYARTHKAIPLWRFLEAPDTVPDLSGQIALIGSSSTFYRDFHPSPMARRHSGPDIHATAIDNILRGESIARISPWINMVLLYLLCMGTFQLRLRVRAFGKNVLYTIGTMILVFWAAFWLLSEQSLWVDVATPELFIVAAFLAGSAFRIFFKEKQLAAMEKNLSQLVDPEVFREIRRLSHILKPGGEKLEITSMFVDIRNFTTLAERLSPNEVTDLLNEFYEAIVSIVFHYQGTIDKFMGDGILIIFGAPLPNEQHRLLALQATLEILAVTERLSRQWDETKDIHTDIGISLNSGVAFVGFLGPTDKLEYTGVGDTVNICVRLQEHTRTFNTRLIMSEETLQGVLEPLAEYIPEADYVSLGEVAVRGRESTIRIYTLKQAMQGLI